MSLHMTFANARQFGLDDDEVWTAMDEVMGALGGEATLDEYLDVLNGALATRILDKQRLGPRQEPSKRRRSLFGDR